MNHKEWGRPIWPLLLRFTLALPLIITSCAAALAAGNSRTTGPPLFGASVEVDPGFGYYQDRSPESIAAEIRANGYRTVHYVVTADSGVDPALIRAYHRESIGVWYSTFGNGTYTTKDLPAGWQSWKMVTRSDLLGKPLDDGYTRLCLNNSAYRSWKKKQIAGVLRAHPFDGVEIMEPHWPEYPGVESPAYACFCDSCKSAFAHMFPTETGLPDIVHPDSPRSPARNPALWKHWLEFRHRTLTAFLNDLVNGPGGIRAVAPRVKVCTWTLALSGNNGLRRVREDSGEDAAEIARIVRPDLHCFQTHWPDWTRPDLPPDYVNAYRPFVAEIRAAAPNLPLMIQADIGSQKQNRQSREWIHGFERACAALSVGSTTLYEYFIGGYMYDEPPRIAEVRAVPGTIRVRFTKRVDPAVAGKTERYALTPGRVLSAKVDGSVVTLTAEGLEAGSAHVLTVTEIPDTPSLRLFDDRPVTRLTEQRVAFTTGPPGIRAAVIRAADTILSHQSSDGVIAQDRATGRPSELIPYYANFAADGLAEAYRVTHEPAFLRGAKQWVAWFAAHQNPDGTIFDYTGKPGEWKSKGTYDSTDSYAATFLELLLNIHRADPDLKWLNRYATAIHQAVRAIRLTLQPNGLTIARPGWPVMYTMDNTETMRGLRAASALLTLLHDSAGAAEAARVARRMKEGIDTLLWDAERKNYRVGIQLDGGIDRADGKWYPDIMANLMAVGWLDPSDRNRALFQRLRRAHANSLPKTPRNEDEVERHVWWAYAARSASDRKAFTEIRDRIAAAYSLNVPNDHPALLGHICRLLAPDARR